MKASRAQIPRLRLSLTQMMKLVLFAAVASATVAPMAQLKEAGVIPNLSAVVLWGGVAAPLACAVTALLVIQPGPSKDWIIRALVLVSVGFALGAAIYFEALAVYLATRGQGLYGFSFIETTAVIVVLGVAAGVLLRRLIPRWCPACRLPTLIADVSARGRLRTENERAYRCIACGDLFSKNDDVWQLTKSGAAQPDM
jgi:hypothetical protein